MFNNARQEKKNMKHKLYITKQAICERCGNKFEKKTKFEKLCERCWTKAVVGRNRKRVQEKRRCFLCKKQIITDRIEVVLYIRNKKVKYRSYPKAWKRKLLYTFDQGCFEDKLQPILKT
jgi:hypothetical protein